MFTVRRAEEGDSEGIRHVHAIAIREIAKSHYTPEEIEAWAKPRKPEHYVESICGKEFYVAEENGIIGGFGTLNQSSGEIEAVYVLPDFTRRGVGLKLLRKLEERARELNIKSLHLNSSLNAASFYEKAGYKQQKESKHRLSSGVEINCILMKKELPS